MGISYHTYTHTKQEMLLKQLMEMWMVMGRPEIFHAVEIGAGTGYLCKDILDYLHKPSINLAVSENKNDFLRSLRYVIVEPYQHFEARQRELLGDYLKCRGGFEPRPYFKGKDEIEEACPELISWVQSLRNPANRVTGCIFSNELLDAFPVHLVVMEDELKEIYVDFDGRKFPGAGEQFFALFAFHNQVHQFSTIGCDEFCFCHFFTPVLSASSLYH